MDCVFCKIVSGEQPRKMIEWAEAIAFRPKSPVNPGHILVIPKAHVADAMEDPELTGKVMARAASLPIWPCNVFTNVGRAAGQTVFHLHIHVVPRTPADRLSIPWGGARHHG